MIDPGTLLTMHLTVFGVLASFFKVRGWFRIVSVTYTIGIGFASLYYTQKAQKAAQAEMFEKLTGGDDYGYCGCFGERSSGSSFYIAPRPPPLHDVSVIITAVPLPEASAEEQIMTIIVPLRTWLFPILYPRMSPLNFTLPAGSYRVDLDGVNGGVVDIGVR